MGAPNGNTCRTCKWFVARTPVQGNCFYNPPTASVQFMAPKVIGAEPIRMESSTYPVAQPNWFCSKHEEAPAPAAANS